MGHPDKQSDYAFQVGQVVHHKRYNYRGVIYERDLVCMAGDDWYHGNQSQPPREQPWYHVLVHGATHSTYVAQSNLVPDTTGDPVIHPLVQKIFQTFFRGRYYTQNLN